MFHKKDIHPKTQIIGFRVHYKLGIKMGMESDLLFLVYYQ